MSCFCVVLSSVSRSDDRTRARTNLTVRGAEGGGVRLVMRKADYLDESMYGWAAGRHGFLIKKCADVKVSDLEIADTGGDGVYVGGELHAPSTNIQLLRVVTLSAYRNGLSITSARDVVVSDCRFLNTSGTAPQAGVGKSDFLGICHDLADP